MLVICFGTMKGFQTGAPLSMGESWVGGGAVSGSSPIVLRWSLSMQMTNKVARPLETKETWPGDLREGHGGRGCFFMIQEEKGIFHHRISWTFLRVCFFTSLNVLEKLNIFCWHLPSFSYFPWLWGATVPSQNFRAVLPLLFEHILPCHWPGILEPQETSEIDIVWP